MRGEGRVVDLACLVGQAQKAVYCGFRCPRLAVRPVGNAPTGNASKGSSPKGTRRAALFLS